MSNLILLELPGFAGKGKASNKLQEIFKSGAKSDVRIRYNGDKVFALHKSYLRQESEYFKELFKSQKEEYDIKMKFITANFEQVISCIYGYSYHVKREDILVYFELCKELRINSLLEIIRTDIKSHFSEYSLFQILDIFYQQIERELYDLAVKQLEEKSYAQLKDSKEVIQIQDIAAFRNLIKLHDRFKQKHKTEISYTDINRIIKDYCRLHHKDKFQQLYQQMRRELINKDHLTSTEFGEIFQMNDTRLFSQRIVRDSSAERRKFAQTQMLPSPLNTSVGSNMRLNASMITAPSLQDLKYENTYMKKKLKEQENETAAWIADFEKLKKQRMQDEKVRIECESINKQFKSIVDIESNNLHKLELRINKLEEDITVKDKLLQKQSEEITKLKEELQRLKSNPALLKEEPVIEDMLVESTIIPHDYLKGLMKPKPKEEVKAKEQEVVEECDRLEFDNASMVVPKKYFHKLLSIIDEDSFNAYKLNLLYRASEMGGRRENFFERISNHSNLLVLVKSDKAMFGGYISIEISAEDSQYLADSSSYIFNVGEGRKFKSKSDQSIFISEEYLICFGEDIMILANCLIEGGTSSWPSTFEGDKALGAGFVCGSGTSHNFPIEQLEVYEIGSAQLQMTM